MSKHTSFRTECVHCGGPLISIEGVHWKFCTSCSIDYLSPLEKEHDSKNDIVREREELEKWRREHERK